MRAYRFVQWLLRTATRVFFRRIEVVDRDHIPEAGEGAVIFCGNHPNSLLDPVLITAHCGRAVHFAAKDTLFRAPVLGALLELMGAVPVKRRADHGDGAVDNSDAFAALHEVLGQGRAVGIFPEGISNDASQLAPLKTGAARIALGAKRNHPETAVYLVPTGLCYFRRNRFRSSVLIQFGAPHEVTAADAEAPDQRQRARELTDDIERHLRALTINADTWETIWVLDGVRRLYQPEGITLDQRVELSRRFNKVYPEVKGEPEVRALYDRVRSYLVRVSAAGITDDVLSREIGVRETAWRIVRHTALLLGALPLAILGAPVHLPLLFVLKLAGTYLAPRKDVVATTKFIAGLFGVLLVYLALVIGFGYRFGLFWGVLIAVLFPLSGRALLHVISRVDALRHIVLTSFRVLQFRKEVKRLRAERGELQRLVIEAVGRYRPADMPSMFSGTEEEE